ncbi:MAG: histidinol-phosphate transaminase [Synoicihabitans sp.]
MNLSELVNPNILSQPVYEPGRPIDDVAREMGLDPSAVIKLASNENPFGASPLAIAAMTDALQDSALYPDGGCTLLREKLGERHGLASNQIVVGNGSNELIELLGHVFLKPGDEVVMGTPAFIVYKLVTLLFGATAIEVPLQNFVHDLAAMKAAITDQTKLVFLPAPNNPTGTINEEEEMLAWARDLPSHVVLVIDEAYAEYLEKPADWELLIGEGKKIVVLRTFSKIFGLAGQRVGYARASSEMAGLLQRARQPFNVNAIAQAGAVAALADHDWVVQCRERNAEGLDQLKSGLQKLGYRYVPSVGNFLLVEVGNGMALFQTLQQRGIIVRPVGIYGLPDWVRITVGTEEENTRLLDALRVESEGC